MATGPRWSTRTSPATFRRAIADLLFAGRVLAAKRAGGRSGRSRREMPGDPGLGRPVKINCANHGTLRRSNTQALFNLIRPAALVTCCRGGGTDGVVQPLAHKISESSCAACRLIGDQALESLGQADRQGRRRGVYSSVAARTVRQVSLSRWRGPPPAPAVERKRRQLVVQRRS